MGDWSGPPPLAPARGTTTFDAQGRPTCSGTPCGCQEQQHTFREHSQAMDEQASCATVHHADLWGPREVYEPDTRGHLALTGDKHFWLAEHGLASTPSPLLNPHDPFSLFTPPERQYFGEYAAGWSLPALYR